ncbi:unnamed protein product [Ceutorhynchus assimilis]|uniref:RING-type domain-containing protein n=1 Tax=Ceutorhynchus assimilis TaxID=467358 RepID=A0A9N9QH74_9CUCU|nr:unnamed protein product [Ceutorhynchus assimilis]
MASVYTNNNSEESINYEPRWYPPIGFFLFIKRELMEKIHYIEQIFVIKYFTAYSFSCQLCFFTLCRPHLGNQYVEDLRKYKMFVESISSILLYSILGYFVFKVRDIWRGSRRRTVAMTARSFINHLKAFCKIILEWAKAAILVLYLREEGLEFEQNLLYCLVTFTYFLCTENVFLKIFPEIIEALQIDKLDNLEHLYVPLFMNFLAIVAGFTIDFYSFIVKSASTSFILLSLYFMVYLRLKDVYYNYWEILLVERETYSSCQVASEKQIEDWDDICAICLNRMSKARITPCNHLFHPHCLKLCLRRSFNCPLCKYCILIKE